MGLRHFLGRRDPGVTIPDATIEQVTHTIANQAWAEVMGLRRGQRLIIERNNDDRTPFTVIVERMDHV